jgi:hypothetical protein
MWLLLILVLQFFGTLFYLLWIRRSSGTPEHGGRPVGFELRRRGAQSYEDRRDRLRLAHG